MDNNGYMGNNNYYYYNMPPVQQKKSGLCTAALVMGILAAVFGLVGLGGLFAILGLIFSIISLAKKLPKKGNAIAGLILSLLSIIWGCTSFTVIVLIIVIGGTAVITAISSFLSNLGMNIDPEYLNMINNLNNGGYNFDVNDYDFGGGDWDYYDDDSWDESWLLGDYDEDDYGNDNDYSYDYDAGFYSGNFFIEDLEQYGYTLDEEGLDAEIPYRDYRKDDAYFYVPEFTYSDYHLFADTKEDAFLDEMNYTDSLEYKELIDQSNGIFEFNDEWDYGYCKYYYYDAKGTYLDYSVYAFPKNSDEMICITVDTSGNDDDLDLSNLINILNYIHVE